MNHDAIVIGAGLFGSIIAAELRSRDLNVLVIDDMWPGSGSKPAACLMKPSWYAGLGEDVAKPALELLDRLYGVHQIKFKVSLTSANVFWVAPSDILPRTMPWYGSVGHVEAVPGGWQVTAAPLGGGTEDLVCSAPLLVVAAGIWTPQLAQVDGGLKAQAGMAFLWPNMQLDQPFIDPWAPYRQLVAFNRGDGLWVGDGSAIKEENWNQARTDMVYERCARAVGRLGFGDVENGRAVGIFGIRPYSAMKPCYLKEEQPGLWVATGGAKNGTMAAGWCAHQISAAL